MSPSQKGKYSTRTNGFSAIERETREHELSKRYEY